MKRIRFDNLGKNKYWIIIMILALIFILIGFFQPFEIKNPKIYKYLNVTGFLLQTIYWSKLFWFKNTVQWNKKGAVIRINSFMGESVSFKEIKKTELVEKKLTIEKNNGEILRFDLNEILESDTQKLNEIIIKNTIANTVYN